MGWQGGRDLASSADFTRCFCDSLYACWQNSKRHLAMKRSHAAATSSRVAKKNKGKRSNRLPTKRSARLAAQSGRATRDWMWLRVHDVWPPKTLDEPCFDEGGWHSAPGLKKADTDGARGVHGQDRQLKLLSSQAISARKCMQMQVTMQVVMLNSNSCSCSLTKSEKYWGTSAQTCHLRISEVHVEISRCLQVSRHVACNLGCPAQQETQGSHRAWYCSALLEHYYRPSYGKPCFSLMWIQDASSSLDCNFVFFVVKLKRSNLHFVLRNPHPCSNLLVCKAEDVSEQNGQGAAAASSKTVPWWWSWLFDVVGSAQRSCGMWIHSLMLVHGQCIL